MEGSQPLDMGQGSNFKGPCRAFGPATPAYGRDSSSLVHDFNTYAPPGRMIEVGRGFFYLNTPMRNPETCETQARNIAEDSQAQRSRLARRVRAHVAFGATMEFDGIWLPPAPHIFCSWLERPFDGIEPTPLVEFPRVNRRGVRGSEPDYISTFRLASSEPFRLTSSEPKSWAGNQKSAKK